MDEGLLSIISASYGQLKKKFITLEPHGIVGSNFTYLFILTSSSHLYAKKGDEAWPIIILAGQGLIVKMLITFKPHHIY